MEVYSDESATTAVNCFTDDLSGNKTHRAVSTDPNGDAFKAGLDRTKEYTILFWADDNSTYDARSLKAVSLATNKSMSEHAYFHKFTGKITTTSVNASLSRAVAKINYQQEGGYFNNEDQTVIVEYNDTYTFNCVECKPIVTTTTAVRTFKMSNQKLRANPMLGTDYHFADPNEGVNTLLNLKVRVDSETNSKVRKIGMMPIGANKATTLKGQFSANATSKAFDITSLEAWGAEPEILFDVSVVGGKLNYTVGHTAQSLTINLLGDNIENDITVSAAPSNMFTSTLLENTASDRGTLTVIPTVFSGDMGATRVGKVTIANIRGKKTVITITQVQVQDKPSSSNCAMVVQNSGVIFNIDVLKTRYWGAFPTFDEPAPFGDNLKAVVLWTEGFDMDAVDATIDETANTMTVMHTGTTNGNALIAIKNKVGTIVWSWHLWVTDYNVSAVTKNNNRNPNSTFNAVNGKVHTYSEGFFSDNRRSNYKPVIMDRNLGATWTGGMPNPTDIGNDVNKARTAYGLYYQWGRKDPFKTGIANENGEGDGPGITAGGRNMAYATANPEVYLSYGMSWEYSQENELWGEEIQWQPYRKFWIHNLLSKSPYDPCPDGWRVPKGYSFIYKNYFESTQSHELLGSWQGFSKSNMPWYLNGEKINNPQDQHKGATAGRLYTSGDNISAWFPASGYRVTWFLQSDSEMGSNGNGATTRGMLQAVGSSGFLWSSSYSIVMLHLRYGNTLSFDTSYVHDEGRMRADGIPVRCVQD